MNKKTEELLKEVMDIVVTLERKEAATFQEAIEAAVQIQRNRILAQGLVVDGGNSYPSALEALAMSAGYK